MVAGSNSAENKFKTTNTLIHGSHNAGDWPKMVGFLSEHDFLAAVLQHAVAPPCLDCASMSSHLHASN